MRNSWTESADVSASVDARQRDPDETNNTVTASVIIRSEPSDNNGGGGLCSYNPDGRFDPVLPLMAMLSLAYLGWRRKQAVRQ